MPIYNGVIAGFRQFMFSLITRQSHERVLTIARGTYAAGTERGRTFYGRKCGAPLALSETMNWDLHTSYTTLASPISITVIAVALQREVSCEIKQDYGRGDGNENI